MMPATESAPYVTCQEYCGKPIHTGEDHAPDCGAPLAERKRITDELKALRLRAAIDSIPTDESDVEVDSQRAKLRRTPAPEPEREMPEWRDPQVPESWIYAAQKAVDEGEVTIGGTGTKSHCPGREMIDGIEVACPHIVFAKSVEVLGCTDSAGENHKHTKAVERMCLIHWIRFLGANIAPAGNGPLFG